MDAPRSFLLALGSNIDPERNLPLALAELSRVLSVESVSAVYETDPVDAPGTPRFLNAAVGVRAATTPHRLRADVLRPIEARLGRVRTGDPNAPRTIDIDLVFVPGLVLEDPASGLSLPDPELARRPHLALPVADIAGDAVHPVLGETLAAIAARLSSHGAYPVRTDVVFKV
jgi:2-amino-4-hydroxy-6-hydroxymethyldihydropteridine diphosphokinase